MANGVLRSWAAEASALVVLRKRSRSCSSSNATFSFSIETLSPELVPEAGAEAGRPSFKLMPSGAAALSGIEAMGTKLALELGRKIYYLQNVGLTLILC